MLLMRQVSGVQFTKYPVIKNIGADCTYSPHQWAHDSLYDGSGLTYVLLHWTKSVQLAWWCMIVLAQFVVCNWVFIERSMSNPWRVCGHVYMALSMYCCTLRYFIRQLKLFVYRSISKLNPISAFNFLKVDCVEIGKGSREFLRINQRKLFLSFSFEALKSCFYFAQKPLKAIRKIGADGHLPLEAT